MSKRSRTTDPDVRALYDTCRALERSSSTRVIVATLRFMWDRYLAHPPTEAWWMDPQANNPKLVPARCSPRRVRPTSAPPDTYEYSGRVYVRPLGRGIMLIDDGQRGRGPQLEEVLADGHWRVAFTARRLTDDEDRAADEAWL